MDSGYKMTRDIIGRMMYGVTQAYSPLDIATQGGLSYSPREAYHSRVHQIDSGKSGADSVRDSYRKNSLLRDSPANQGYNLKKGLIGKALDPYSPWSLG